MIISTPSDSRNIRGNRISRIDTPGVHRYVWGVIDTTSNVLSDADNVEKFDTRIQSSTTQERNLESSCIEEVGVKIILSEIFKEFDSSGRVNLAISVLSESPKLKSLGHPTIETADIRKFDFTTSTRGGTTKGMAGWVIRMILKL